MAIIKITDDNNNKQSYNLLGYSIRTKEEKVIILEINTSVSSVKYRIWSDSRESDINKIELFISDLFDTALKNNKTVYLDEYLVRMYIYIGDGIEIRKQFSAKKI